MAKKNFKAATEDIFGAYKEPTNAVTIEKKAPKIYELFLLSVDKTYLAQLQADAEKSGQEIKDILDAILSNHYKNR